MLDYDEQQLNDFIKSSVPRHDWSITLEALTPSQKSKMPLAMQQKIIALLRTRPNQGWAFFGPAGWSKTTFSSALLRAALVDGWEPTLRLRQTLGLRALGEMAERKCCWRMTAAELLDQFHAYMFRNDSESGATRKPEVRRESIRLLRQHGFPCSLFLEELDKIKNTKHKMDTLFEVINALYEYEAQLVISSNLTPKEFQDSFGPEFARRIGEMCNTVNCFTEEINLIAEPTTPAEGLPVPYRRTW